MVDSLEPRDWDKAAAPHRRPELEVESAKLHRAGPSATERSDSADHSDRAFAALLTDPERPLRIERTLGGWRGRLSGLLVYCWRPIFFVLRRRRVWSLFNVNVITRFDDVQEVLARDDIFRTPFRAKAAQLNWSPPFLLDQQYGADYRAVKEDVTAFFKAVNDDFRRVMKGSDLELVKTAAFAAANEILNGKIAATATAEIDVIRELVCRVPTRVCQTYYGVTSLAALNETELRELEDCFITVSAYMFGDAEEPPEALQTDEKTLHARQAAVIIRATIRKAVEQAWQDRAAHVPRDDVLFRMVQDDTEESDPADPGRKKRRFDDARMTSYLFAMMLGFIPTNLMANGNMLEILFARPDELELAKEAARSGDDDLLRRYLFEAMRFRPLNPGPWRRANCDFLLGADGKRPKRLKQGRTIWPCTQSAMFDSNRVRAPRQFDVDRSPYVYMVYGFGLHRCIGKPMADVQITQTMKALFLRRNLRSVGPQGLLKRISMFPARMLLRYDSDAAPGPQP